MAIASGEEMALTTGTNLDIVTQQSTQITAGKNLVARVKDRISLFAYKLGVKVVAASGKVEIQAHSDNIEMTAAKNIFGTALDEVIWRTKKFTIITDGASLEIGPNGIISKTSGAHTRHAGKHTMTGPAGVPLALPALPHSELVAQDSYSHEFDIGSMLHNDPTLDGASYQIWTKEKVPLLLAEGVINNVGRTVRVYTQEQKEVEIMVGENEWLTADDLEHTDTQNNVEDDTA